MLPQYTVATGWCIYTEKRTLKTLKQCARSVTRTFGTSEKQHLILVDPKIVMLLVCVNIIVHYISTGLTTLTNMLPI